MTDPEFPTRHTAATTARDYACQQIPLFQTDDPNIVSWLNRDIDALNYFAGDVHSVPKNLWEHLERLRARRGEEIYSDLLMALIHKKFPSQEARRLWQEILEHKYFMSEKLGRNVGIRVAALDFLHNQRGLIRDLRLLPEQDLDCLLLFVNEDGLTGVYNHRYFQEQLQHELVRARRYKRSLSLLLLDLDRFKHYNDHYGHRQGDHLLKEAAGFFDHSKRESDTVARYGGDEFAIILPETNADEALTYAKRLRAEFEVRQFGGELEGGAITISVGLSSFPMDAETQEELIEAADQALYRAKRAGRNCIRSSQAPSD